MLGTSVNRTLTPTSVPDHMSPLPLLPLHQRVSHNLQTKSVMNLARRGERSMMGLPVGRDWEILVDVLEQSHGSAGGQERGEERGRWRWLAWALSGVSCNTDILTHNTVSSVGVLQVNVFLSCQEPGSGSHYYPSPSFHTSIGQTLRRSNFRPVTWHLQEWCWGLWTNILILSGGRRVRRLPLNYHFMGRSYL